MDKLSGKVTEIRMISPEHKDKNILVIEVKTKERFLMNWLNKHVTIRKELHYDSVFT